MKRLGFYLCIFLFLCSQLKVSAQYKLVLKTVTFPVDLDWVYDQLPQDQEFSSQQDELRFIAEFNYEQLLEVAENVAYDEVPIIENSILYFDQQGFVAEIRSGDELSRMLYRTDENTIYMISETSKQALFMSKSDMEALDEMIAETDMDSKIMELQDDGDVTNERRLESTGRSMTINGFSCNEYLSVTDDSYVQVWASRDNSGLTDQINGMVEKLEQSFNTGSDEGDNGLAYQVPGHINILVTEISYGFMSGLSYQREEYMAIEKEKVPEGLFKIPTQEEGYTLISYRDLLDQMQKAFDDTMDE